jgi:hypothetical protein
MSIRNPKFQVPDYSNATDGYLIDELAKTRAMSNWLKRQDGVLKEVLYSRLGREPSTKRVEGERFASPGIKKGQMTILDGDKIKEDMPEEWVKEHQRTIEFPQIELEAKETTIGHEELQSWLKNLDAELFS